MTINSTTGKTSITKGQCYLRLTASVMTYLLITMGGIVCVTESGRGCPDWPGCFGQIVPPMQSNAIIEYLHRFIAALTTPLIILSAIVGWRNVRAIRWVSRPPLFAVALTFAVIVFGAFAVLTGLPPALAVLDLGSALIVLALMIAATVVAFARRDNPALPDSLSFRAPFARLTMWTAGAMFLVLVSGVLVAESSSLTRCLGLPLYNEPLVLADLRGWLLLARRLLAGAAAILIVAVVVQAWRMQRAHAAIVRAASLVGILFLTEATIGILMLTGGFASFLLVIYVAAAAALWATLIVLVVMVGIATPDGTPPNGIRRLSK